MSQRQVRSMTAHKGFENAPIPTQKKIVNSKL